MQNRFFELRNSLGLTLEAFGARIGITRAAVSNIEKGRSNASDQVIRSICREFHVSEKWLRTGAGEMFEGLTRDQAIAEFAADLMSDEDESFRKRFVSILAMLDADDWAMLERFAKKIADKQKTDP